MDPDATMTTIGDEFLPKVAIKRQSDGAYLRIGYSFTTGEIWKMSRREASQMLRADSERLAGCEVAEI